MLEGTEQLGTDAPAAEVNLALTALCDTRRSHATAETLLVKQKSRPVARRTAILRTQQVATVTAGPALGEL